MKISIIISLLMISLNYSAQVEVKLSNSKLITSKDNLELNIQSEYDIMGIQFDMQYNTSELMFNGANAIPSGYTFEYAESDKGLIRGLMFSMEGIKLNQQNIQALISFDFKSLNNFTGISTIEFTEVIIADRNANELKSSLPIFNINTNDLLPKQTILHASYPNPFNPITTISYDLVQDENVSIVVFDALGREVSELISGVQFTGNYSIDWDASNHASGTYFIRMKTDSYTTTQRIVLLK